MTKLELAILGEIKDAKKSKQPMTRTELTSIYSDKGYSVREVAYAITALVDDGYIKNESKPCTVYTPLLLCRKGKKFIKQEQKRQKLAAKPKKDHWIRGGLVALAVAVVGGIIMLIIKTNWNTIVSLI